MIDKLRAHWIGISVLLGVVLLSTNLNPFDGRTFSGHDETQAARVIEFSHNLAEGQFPPRIAPHMSFELGYPLFNYYAPTAYWITSTIYLLGFNVAQALEISYFLALVVGLIGFYFFVRTYFSNYAATTAALLYISSPFVALDIFVRSNLGEIWFYALFPWALALLQRLTRKRFFVTIVIIAALFTSHNIFSLLSIPILMIFSWMHKSKMQFVAVLLSIVLASYFLMPAVGELEGVQASTIATITQYQVHFLCPLQLWYSSWGYGGSIEGCVDGMSFMLGKVHIITGIAGVGFLILNTLKKKSLKSAPILFTVLTLLLGSLFMTFSVSSFLWKLFEPILSIFQFPWRLLLFVIFGLSFFGGYAINSVPKKFSLLVTIVVIATVLFLSPKFFKGQNISEQVFLSTYASNEYIRNTAAFRVAEYLPRTVNYESWRQLERESIKPQIQAIGFSDFKIETAETTVLPIHYAPYWKITIDGEEYVPTSLDNLGRPRIKVEDIPVSISVTYAQTPLQQLANIISLVTGILVLIYSQPHKWQIKKT
ncbi:glycosyltransferase family 39 protein [Candidatus Woesebacteria bacterium]|nr:glycosyltransferase family 39 protein [Candidatus Woesebacteria bacterium]